MYKQYVSLIIYLLTITQAVAMEMQPTKVQSVPSLKTTCINRIVTGYGATDAERQKNGVVFIKALQTNQHKSALLADQNLINACTNKYIGAHGWGVEIAKDRPKIIVTRTVDIASEFLIPYSREEDLYCIAKQDNIYIFNIKTGKIKYALRGHSNSIRCCTNISNGIIASGSFDTTIKIWNVNKQQILHSLCGNNEIIENLAASPNMIASSGNYYRQVKLWDVASGLCTDTIDIESIPHSLAIHNNMIYVGSYGITVFDPRLKNNCRFGDNGLVSITFLIASQYNNALIYSGGGQYDSTVKQWDLRNLAACVNIMHADIDTDYADYGVINIHETYDGKKIFASNKRRLFAWDVSHNIPQLFISASINNDFIINHCMAMNNDENELYLGTWPYSTGTLKVISPNCTFEELCEK